MSPWDVLAIGVILIVAIQRLLELRLSKKNEKYLLQNGAKEFAPKHLVFMKSVHSFWFVAMLAELLLLDQNFHFIPCLIFTLVFLLGQFLRILAIRTLGKRWNVKIYILPDQPPIASGVYSKIRHPNYLGVVLEFLALPLIFNLWITCIIFSVLNLWVLKIRIKEEEIALNSAV